MLSSNTKPKRSQKTSKVIRIGVAMMDSGAPTTKNGAEETMGGTVPLNDTQNGFAVCIYSTTAATTTILAVL